MDAVGRRAERLRIDHEAMTARSRTPALFLAFGLTLLGCATPSPAPEPPPEPPERPRAARELPGRDAPSFDPAAARRLVQDHYIETDTLGLRAAVGRFRNLGGATATDLLPEPEFCHVYFGVDDGTWCYRAQYGEPFRTRRVDAFSRPGAAAAGRLLEEAPGVPYASIRGLLFVAEHVEADDLACASFFVRELRVSLEDADFGTFLDAPTGRVADGVACVDRGTRWTIYRPAEQNVAYRLWDRVPLGEDEVAVVFREGDEVSWFEVYAIGGGEPLLVAAVEVWP